MTASGRDVELISAREFDRWCDARAFTPAFRSHMRKHWLAGFRHGLELGVTLARGESPHPEDKPT